MKAASRRLRPPSFARSAKCLASVIELLDQSRQKVLVIRSQHTDFWPRHHQAEHQARRAVNQNTLTQRSDVHSQKPETPFSALWCGCGCGCGGGCCVCVLSVCCPCVVRVLSVCCRCVWCVCGVCGVCGVWCVVVWCGVWCVVLPWLKGKRGHLPN